jgi:hypothetical protein
MTGIAGSGIANSAGVSTGNMSVMNATTGTTIITIMDDNRLTS